MRSTLWTKLGFKSYTRLSAYHEAAHAVVCMEFGGTFDYLIIHDKGGSVEGMRLRGDTQKALMFLAGIAAFKLLDEYDRWNRVRSRDDRLNAREFLHVERFHSRKEEDAVLDRLTEVAGKILTKRRAAWTALSELLYERERVDYLDARKLMETSPEGATDVDPIDEAALIQDSPND